MKAYFILSCVFEPRWEIKVPQHKPELNKSKKYIINNNNVNNYV